MIQVPLGPLIEAVESCAPTEDMTALFEKLSDLTLQVTGGDMVKVETDFT